MSPSKPSLATLSLDLLINIMEDLHIIDIIALRQTCKTLFTATHERIIWLVKLKESCRRNHIYLPTFTLPQMTSAQLEHAATSPHRSLRVLTRGNSKPRPKTLSDPYGQLLRRYNTRNIKILQRESYPLHRPFLYLTPGGRWLLNFVDEIELYDLGYPGAPYQQVARTEEETPLLVPVASHKREFVHPTWFDVYRSPTEQSLRVLQRRVGVQDADGPSALVLLEINPQDPNPQFVEIFRYKHQAEDYIIAAALSGDDLFIIQGDTLKVQNIKTRAWTWWSVDPYMIYQRILPRKYDLTILHDTGAHVYPYPTLDRIGQPMFEESVSPNPHVDHAPKLRRAMYTLSHMDNYNRDYVMGEQDPGVLNGWYYNNGAENEEDADEVSLIWDKPQWTVLSNDEDEEGGGDKDKDGGESEDDEMESNEDDEDSGGSDGEGGDKSGVNHYTPDPMTTRSKPKASSPSPFRSNSDSDLENDPEDELRHAKENPRLDLCRYQLRISLSPSSPFNPLVISSSSSSSANPRLANVADQEEVALDEEFDLWEAEYLSDVFPLTCAAFPMQGIRLCEGALVSVWGRQERLLFDCEGNQVEGLRGKAKDHKAYVNVNSLPHLAKGPEHVPLSKPPGDLQNERERKKARKSAVGLFELDDGFERHDGDQESYSSFCPFAGRVVYICDEEEEVDPVVVVFDLF